MLKGVAIFSFGLLVLALIVAIKFDDVLPAFVAAAVAALFMGVMLEIFKPAKK